ncbi:MAG: glycerol-3-phosphate acyltransferase [Actinomycetota bacterium]|jgi:glycerol-3-phosphate acyltransferase PlsY|nr:glycerol-3-phosphate acyltransferase [Actinomycetota bacterium]
MIQAIADLGGIDALKTVALFVIAYMVGSIPFAYVIVKRVSGEDITTHGSGNVGAMNVRRTTGSWGWFTVAMLSDLFKGFTPVMFALFAGTWGLGFSGTLSKLAPGNLAHLDAVRLGMMAAVLGAVLGHNYSLWMAMIRKRFARSGKGLASGAGALLVYDWRYFIAVVVVGLATIAVTRYMMAGQVAGAATLPTTALLLGSPDWPFALGVGFLVYVAHHKRFIGMLKGQEPRFYVNDSMGPRG